MHIHSSSFCHCNCALSHTPFCLTVSLQIHPRRTKQTSCSGSAETEGLEDVATQLHCRQKILWQHSALEISGSRSSQTGYSIHTLRWGLRRKREWNIKLSRCIKAERTKAKRNQHKVSISIHINQLVNYTVRGHKPQELAITKRWQTDPVVPVQRDAQTNLSVDFFISPC